MQQLDYDESETPSNEDFHIIECDFCCISDKRILREKAEEVGEIVMEITTLEGCVFFLRVDHFPKGHIKYSLQKPEETASNPEHSTFLV